MSTCVDRCQRTLTTASDDSPISTLQELTRQLEAQPDPVARIPLLTAIASLTTGEAMSSAVAEARQAGKSWQVIGEAAGISRQAANLRWRQRDEGDEAIFVQVEPPVPSQPSPEGITRSRKVFRNIGNVSIRGSVSIAVKPRKHR